VLTRHFIKMRYNKQTLLSFLIIQVFKIVFKSAPYPRNDPHLDTKHILDPKTSQSKLLKT